MDNTRRLSPSAPLEQQPCIGLIGMGDMGSMYAHHLSNAGWKKCASCLLFIVLSGANIESRMFHANSLIVCDRADKFEDLKTKWKGKK